MANWFGKGCQYLCAQWEDNEITGGPNYQESEPVLTFCTHPVNISDHEGNCTPALCPEDNKRKRD